MANVTFVYPCITDDARLVPGGKPWPDSLSKLQDARLSRVARSATTQPTDTCFDVDLHERRLMGGVALVRHNLTLSATWRVRASLNADMSDPLYDSGWVEAWGQVYPFGSLPWGSPNWWDGRMSERDRASYPGLLVALLPAYTVARYLRIEINDPGNPAGYIELGRLFVGEAWSPQFNAAYGASVQWTTNTTSDTALDGTPYFDRRAGAREWAFSLEWLNGAEAFGVVFEMQRTLGLDQQLLLLFDPDDGINMLRKSFLGNLKTLNPIEQPYFDLHTTAFQVKESR